MEHRARSICHFLFIALTLLVISSSRLAFGAQALTWRDCVRLAEDNSAEIKVARGTLETATAERRSSFGNYLPDVKATTSFTRANETTGSTAVDRNEAYATLSLTQNIFNGFGDLSRYQKARAAERAAQANLAIVKARVSADLKTAFASLAFARQSLALADDIVRRRKQNLSLVQLRFEGGRENKGSVLLSEAYLKEAEFERLRAVGSIETAQASLARIVGREPEEIASVMGDLPLSTPPLKIDFQSLASMTPTHSQAVEQAEQSRQDVRVARASLLPSLALTASVGKQDNTWYPQATDRWSVGLGLTIPLFSGGKDFYTVRAAHASLATSQATLENTDRQLLVTLRESYNSYVQAVEKALVDQKFLAAARTRAEIGRGKYNNGLLGFEEWDLIENDLINREKNQLTSQRDRVSAEAAWEQAQGKGVIP